MIPRPTFAGSSENKGDKGGYLTRHPLPGQRQASALRGRFKAVQDKRLR